MKLYHGSRIKQLFPDKLDAPIFANPKIHNVLGYTVDEDGELFDVHGKRAGYVYEFTHNPSKVVNLKTVDELPSHLDEFKKAYKSKVDFDPTNNAQHRAWMKDIENLEYDTIDSSHVNKGDAIVLNPKKSISRFKEIATNESHRKPAEIKVPKKYYLPDMVRNAYTDAKKER